jgi:DNA-binding response OmpR family regulator
MPNEFVVNVLMLIEDSDNDIIITQRKIFKSSLRIGEFIVVKSLEEALRTIVHKHVDVVLLDLNLPDSIGLDTLIELRKSYDGIIVVLTSIDNELVGVEAIRRGADDYIVKHTLTEELLSKSILYARERRTTKSQVKAIQDKLNILGQQIGG